MPYEDKERDMGFDEQAMYEEDPAYGTDTYFAERLDEAPQEEAMDEDEPMVEEDYFGEQVVTDDTGTTEEDVAYEEESEMPKKDSSMADEDRSE